MKSGALSYDEGYRLLSEGGGTVEALGSRAAYVRTPSEDVVILTDRPLTRYSVSLFDSWEDLRKVIEVGDRVSIERSTLTIGAELRVPLRVRGLCSRVTGRSDLSPESLSSAISYFRALASVDERDPVVERGVEILRSSASADALCESLKEVVGKGRGYTPVGDDFVSGVMVAFKLLGRESDFRPLVEFAKSRSRWPSWKMMEHSLHGCTFLSVMSLCASIAKGSDPTPHVMSSLRMGSSTGLAVLTGLFETLFLYYRSLSNMFLRSSSISAGGLHSTSTTSTP
ncbi:MAG: DUF2877 domain-containing protein [Candidatus Caldarchaeales archaeon]